jgi:hypothetical protein
MSRIIICRDTRREWRAIGDGNESERPALSVEIVHAAENFAAGWVLHTKGADMIEAPVATKTLRRKDRKDRGWIEIVWLSRPRLIYPVKGGYNFGIDATGALYDYVQRRNMDFTEDIHFWMPMGDVESSRYSTAVLKGHLLPYLNDMARH